MNKIGSSLFEKIEFKLFEKNAFPLREETPTTITNSLIGPGGRVIARLIQLAELNNMHFSERRHPSLGSRYDGLKFCMDMRFLRPVDNAAS